MTIAIYGLGLIGGSLGRTITKKTSHTVIGFDVERAAVHKALMLEAISAEITEENIKNADLVILATNPNIAVKIMKETVGKLKDGCTVIDVCGTKRKIVREMEKLFDESERVNFVGCHPMSGKETSGIENSSAALFNNAYFILTPVRSPIEALMKVKSLFTEMGCQGIVIATAEKHDRMISYTSQLAHLVSSAYIQNPLAEKHVGFSAGSFTDMTRVAKLNPTMWTELFLDNKDNLLKQLTILQDKLNEFKEALEKGDADALKKLLESGTKMKETAEAARKAGYIND